MTLYRTLHLIRGCGLLRPHPSRYRCLQTRLVHLTLIKQTQAPPANSRNPIKRIIRYFRNDPFARVSIMFGGVVLIVLLIIEAMIPKQRKNVKPQVGIFPPQVSHYTVSRQREISTLLSRLPSRFFSFSPSVVVVTGPPGSGKTELIRQFVSEFTESSSPLISKKESLKPIVVYVNCDGTFPYKPHPLGIDSVAKSLGIEVKMDTLTLPAILNKLGQQKAKWLLVLDDIQIYNKEEVIDFCDFLEGVTKDRKLRKGYILISSSTENEESLKYLSKHRVSLKHGLTHSEASELFYKLMGKLPDAPVDQPLNELFSYLNYSPNLIAYAGLTNRLILSGQQMTDHSQIIKNYHNILMESHDSHVTEKVTQTYISILCEFDNYFHHSLDFLSLCNLKQPVPSSLIKQHLKNAFYRLPNSMTSSLLVDTPTPIDTPPSEQSYFSMIKEKIPFIGGSSPETPLLPLEQVQGPDILQSLRHSPFVHTCTRNGIELLTFKPFLQQLLSHHFIHHTVPKMEKEHLTQDRLRWNEGAWFKRFRTFDEKGSLDKYRRRLPGLEKALKVYTEKEWKDETPCPSLGPYYNYIHYLSHTHRVLASMSEELKYLSRDPDDLALRKYIKPHLEYLSGEGMATKQDELKCRSNLLSIDATLSSDKETYYNLYSYLIKEMEDVFGRDHHEIANMLTSMAELRYFNGRYHEAKELLSTAVDIHERGPSPRSRSFSQSLDLASTLATLGLVYASLDEKQTCLSTLEKALGLFQAIPSDGDIPKKQRRLVATAITDLGHAYVSVGDLISAKRYLDLSLVAQRSIHGNDHPEVARTLNVLSIVYSLSGDNEQSRESRREAGKIQEELGAMTNTI